MVIKRGNAIVRHVENEDKVEYKKLNFKAPAKRRGLEKNFQTNTIYINESGLYCLVFSSKLPQARVFKHWVTRNVLPSIRKTGVLKIKITTKTN